MTEPWNKQAGPRGKPYTRCPGKTRSAANLVHGNGNYRTPRPFEPNVGFSTYFDCFAPDSGREFVRAVRGNCDPSQKFVLAQSVLP
jgi:hypothetical protein